MEHQQHIPLPRWEFEVSRRETTATDLKHTSDLKHFDADYVLQASFVLTTNKHEYIVIHSTRGNSCHRITKTR